MIDSKTRKKIITLWRQGESKASIQRKTKVSQPSIRKILIELELEGENPVGKKTRKNAHEKPEERVQPISTVFEDDESLIYHKFILNFTEVIPRGSQKGNTWQVMAKGISVGEYQGLLGKVFDPQSVAAIATQLNSFKISGHAFEVTLEQGLHGIHKIQIKRLTTKETRYSFTLPGEEPFNFGNLVRARET